MKEGERRERGRTEREREIKSQREKTEKPERKREDGNKGREGEESRRERGGQPGQGIVDVENYHGVIVGHGFEHAETSDTSKQCDTGLSERVSTAVRRDGDMAAL